MTDFDMLGLNPGLMAAIARMGLNEPTPIQARAIPPAMEGRDIMGLAQTGTGKTLAFGLPLLHRLESGARPARGEVRALILAPTRELVSQIADSLRVVAQGGRLSIVTVVGGASLGRQAERLSRGTDVLVATPGRLIDLLERRALSLGETRMLVLDEADQMLDMGFIHALRRIARHLPAERQTMLFSATMSKEMGEIAETYLRQPVRVQVNSSGQTADRIEQAVHFVAQGDKAALLAEYLGRHTEESALVFARTKHGAEKLMKLLVSWGFAAGSIHGNKSQGQRERTLKAFREGEMKVLVATDVAARGIDIPLVAHVYNYELPNVAENYVHRIGRTARAGRAGQAMAFCAPAEMADLRAIEALTRQPIAVAGGTPWPSSLADEARAKARKQTGGRGGQGGRGGGAGAKGAGAKPAAARAPRAAQPRADGAGGKRRRPRRHKAA